MTQSSPKAVPRGFGDLLRRSSRPATLILSVIALANVAVLAWSFGDVPIGEKIVEPLYLLFAGLLAFVPFLTNVLRLVLWGRFLKVDIGFLACLRIVTGAVAASSLGPLVKSGAPFRFLFLVDEGVSTDRALSIISFQWVEDLVVLVTLSVLSIGYTGFMLIEFLQSEPNLLLRLDQILQSVGNAMLWTSMVVLALSVLVVSGLIGKRVRDWIGRIWQRSRSYLGRVGHDWAKVARHGKQVAASNIALALVQWISRFSVAGLVVAAFGTHWQPALYWLLQYMVQNISSLVLTPGGAGGSEAGFLLLFAPFVSPDNLLPAMSSWRLIFFFLPLAGATIVWFLLNSHRKIRPKDPSGIPENEG